MRIMIFTGKGGVGKTSVAAAHGIKSAKEGKNTILISTDMAHNLEDLFEVRLGKNPVRVMAHLDVYEIDPNYVLEHDFADATKFLKEFIPAMEGNSMEDFGMLPGMEELFSLLKIGEIYKSKKYERIIVDCAPTGETLSLLKFPELLSWYMEKLFPIEKVAMRVLAPVSKQLFKVSLPNQSAMTDIERMYLKLRELQELLKDKETTSVRLVTIPEKMVVEETKRNYMYMNLYNFNVDGLYINRILPQNMDNEFFDEWLKIQNMHIKSLKESFAGHLIFEIPWYEEEIKGIESVSRICKEVLNDKRLFEPYVNHQRETFFQNEDGYVLSLYIPNAKKEDLDLYQSEKDVVIKLNNFKRNIPLPNALRNYIITSAKLEEGLLEICFEKWEEVDE